ncbi:thioredoxin [Sulfolobus acidocaldarius SUSAZ]|nr:thioredoxin [Sulfolobus acidocaldarius SUSAZ]
MNKMDENELNQLINDISRKLEEKAKNVIQSEDPTVQINDGNIDEIISKNNVVFVDCWAPWCGPCHLYEPVFKRVALKYKGKAVFGRLNVDDNANSADKFGVLNIPTTLIFVGGKLVDQVVGAVEEEILEEYVKKYVTN